MTSLQSSAVSRQQIIPASQLKEFYKHFENEFTIVDGLIFHARPSIENQ